MAEETVVTKGKPTTPLVRTPIETKATSSQTVEYIIYFFFGVLEFLLAFRLVLKLLGASQASMFVRAIYGVTSIFVLPFEGIFRKGVTQGIETASVLEPSTIVALIVYALLSAGIVQLMRILAGKQPDSE